MYSLPQFPIIVPLIVTGVLLGSLWQNKTLIGVWKKVFLFAAVAGALNSVNAFLVSSLRTSGADSNNPVASMIASGLVGFLVVFTVFVVVAGMVKYRRGEELEKQQE